MIENLLVIGGGVGGATTALAAAKAGAKVVLVEKRAILGGKQAPRLGGEGPSSGNGVDLPRTSELIENENIEVLTLSEVVELSGERGDFNVSIREQARYITDACTQCNKCRAVCPITLPNEYEAELSYRKAIFSPLKEGFPAAYVIDIGRCLNSPPNYLPCQRCVEVCEDDCIVFDMPPEQVHQRKADAVVVAVGFDVATSDSLSQFGYGEHSDILTSMELEHLLAPSGLTGGYLEKPSNEECPESVLIAITDATELLWAYSASQITRLVEQDITDITVVYHGDSSNGAAHDEFKQHAVNAGAKLIRGDVEKIEGAEKDALRAQYTDGADGQKVSQNFDLVVLASSVLPAEGLAGLAETLSLNLDENGFVHVDEGSQGPVTAARPGVYVIGGASGPLNISDTFARSKAVAAVAVENTGGSKQASAEVAAGDGTPLTEKELQERLEKFVWSLVEAGRTAKA